MVWIKEDIITRHSGQAKRELEEGETGTVEKLAWAIYAGFPLVCEKHAGMTCNFE